MARPRKPTELKKTLGTFTKTRNLTNEFAPDLVTDFEAPDFLSVNQKKVFTSLASRLVEQNLFSVMDFDMIVSYSIEYDRYIEAIKKSKKLIVINEKGESIVNRYLSIANEALKNVIKISTEFGLTPASRSRVSGAPKSGGTIAEIMDKALMNAF